MRLDLSRVGGGCRGGNAAPSSAAPTRGSVLILAFVTLAFFSLTTWASDERELATATFAGGCFWCMEPPYDRIDGVIETISGFSGGHVSNPSYDQVIRGGTGHLEVVKVIYDPAVVDYDTLLWVFWRNIDPYQADGQFCDLGEIYRSAIFVDGQDQAELAQASLDKLAESGPEQRPIDTRILPFEAFYPAEDYHQGYYLNNSVRYRYYRWRCGRDQRLEALWGDQAGGPLTAR